MFYQCRELEILIHVSQQQAMGIYTETSFVLASGIYTTDGKFKVNELGMPPPEDRAGTRYLVNRIMCLSLFQLVQPTGQLFRWTNTRYLGNFLYVDKRAHCVAGV